METPPSSRAPLFMAGSNATIDLFKLRDRLLRYSGYFRWSVMREPTTKQGGCHAWRQNWGARAAKRPANDDGYVRRRLYLMPRNRLKRYYRMEGRRADSQSQFTSATELFSGHSQWFTVRYLAL